MARDKSEKCITPWCRNRKAFKLTRYTSTVTGAELVYESFLPRCWKCQARLLLERHPHTYVLNMLRHSARKRKLPFTITLVEFKKFCVDTAYLEKRGNQPTDLTIDRINVNEGYHIWNIRVLTHAANSEQGADNTPRWERGAANTEDEDDNQPF